jgi:pimeloyl-ACP methyl ester carboxylesterase
VRDKTRDVDQVDLVAHSMGGLICRSLIQRYLEKPLEKISKVFTYGSPHGGIEVEFGGPVGEWVMETFGPTARTSSDQTGCTST